MSWSAAPASRRGASVGVAMLVVLAVAIALLSVMPTEWEGPYGGPSSTTPVEQVVARPMVELTDLPGPVTRSPWAASAGIVSSVMALLAAGFAGRVRLPSRPGALAQAGRSAEPRAPPVRSFGTAGH